MEKIVDFTWCKTCTYYKEPEDCDRCNECLNNSVRDDSHKPLKYEEKGK